MKYIILILPFLIGCAESLVYSPSISLQEKKIKKGEFVANGSFELLPETRPERAESGLSEGLAYGLSYGVDENSSIRLKGWNSINSGSISHYRHGYSIGYMIDNSENSTGFIHYPRFSFVLDENSIEGGAISFNSVYRKKFTNVFALYGGGGLVLGWRDVINEVKNQYGYGVLINFGASYRVYKNLGINVELNPVFQINRFDENTNFLTSPSIGFYLNF